ncbi:16S rRNA (cytidine(1402)-2'-O)-methyltransferase [Chloroflexota bacterium]
MPSLYIVATPIGNLEDISLRAMRILRSVSLIAAEDTRRTRQLLSHYDIRTPMTSYHEHNKRSKLGYILDSLEMGDVALVSDAGMPGMSDPGYELIAACIQRDIPVIPIPGPSCIITALVVSGLATDSFTYLGFLPRKAGARKKRLESLATQDGTMIVLESPHRLLAALSDMLLTLGDRNIAVCRELTKIYEEVFRGTISQALEHFTLPRGEFTLVIAGQGKKDEPVMTDDIQRQLQEMRRSGMKARTVMAEMATETGLSRKELYQAWLKVS